MRGIKPLDAPDTRRDLFARVAVKLGGERLDYRGLTPGHGDTTSFGIGAFLYWGAEGVVPPPMMPMTPPRFTNDLARGGGALPLRTHGVDLLGQAVLRRDENLHRGA